MVHIQKQNEEVKSAVRVLEILELLARSTHALTLRAIVSELGYPKSSAFKLLATLVARGYVMRDDADAYAIHDAFRQGPGWAGGGEASLIAAARTTMEALRDRCDETVFLGSRRNDGRVKILAKCVSRQAIRFDSELSGSEPAFCTAMGRVLLSHWSAQKTQSYLSRERIVQITPQTVIDRVQLRRIIERARVDGYAISDEEAVPGGSGVAAPVRDATGEVFAALDMATVSTRFAARRSSMIQAVVEAAEDLSLRLGYTSGKMKDGHPL